MTSESPSTSKADEPIDTTDDSDSASRSTRARSGAPTRSVPRSRSRSVSAGAEGSPNTLFRTARAVRPATVTPPAPKPDPFRTRRLEETQGPDLDAEVRAVRLAVGVFVGVHGIQGELKLQLWTDAPEHLGTVKRVWVGDEVQPRRIVGFRSTRDRGLVRLSNVLTPEVARTMVGQRLFISGADARPLDENELFLFQLVGLRVITESGEVIGTIGDVIETGANDVLVIRPDEGGPDVLFPHHRDFVVAVDLAAKTMTVRPLDYLN